MGRPDWILYGMQVADDRYPDIKVALYASNRLSMIEVERIFRNPYDFIIRPDGSVIAPNFEYIRLTAVMHRCTVVGAGSYVEALARLFNIWDPAQDPESPSLIEEGQSQKLLGDGRG